MTTVPPPKATLLIVDDQPVNGLLESGSRFISLQNGVVVLPSVFDTNHQIISGTQILAGLAEL
jgi:hypothetical protein